MAGAEHLVTTIRLCVDLNIWVKQFISEAMGRRGTIAHKIKDAVFDGRSGIGSIQLIISHTMLTRLQEVLIRKGASTGTAGAFIEDLANIALIGPAGEFPRIVLGGGVQPTNEARMPGYNPYDPGFVSPPYDPEDGRVLDTALSARADAIVTTNMKHFTHYTDDVVVRDRVHIRKAATGDIMILQPEEALAWLQSGVRPRPIPAALMRRRRARRDAPGGVDEPGPTGDRTP